MRRDVASANSFGLATMGANKLVRILGDWTKGTGNLNDRLANQLRVLINTGVIPSGTRLPSERALATSLHISRNTVAKAFDALRGSAVISSRQGDGTYVSAGVRHTAPRGEERLRSFSADEQQEICGRIDLRSAALPGLPMVAGAANSMGGARMLTLIRSHGYLPSGLPEFREAVSAYYSALGLPTDPEQILVTSGAQQALRLVASMFVIAGDTVLIEEPSFRGAIESLKALGARLVGIPSGIDGIDVDALASAVARTNPVLIVVQSTVHNPTGSVMNTFRRSRVATIAARSGIPVIDDVTLSDTILDGERRPLPIAVGGGRIILTGSMSKSFWGGLRVGWVRAERDFVEELSAAKGGEDLGTSILSQLLASQLLPQIERARDERHAVLSESRRLVLDSISALLPDWESQRPTGGASLWIRLPSACATAFAQKAERDGVLVLPGPTFSATDQLDDHLRVSYSGDQELTARGVEMLARAWERFDHH